MALRSNQQQSHQKFEAKDLLTFEDALEDAIDVLEKNKINGLVGEPDVIIVMRHNGNHTGGDKLIDAVIYIGALPSEVAADLNLLTV